MIIERCKRVKTLILLEKMQMDCDGVEHDEEEEFFQCKVCYVWRNTSEGLKKHYRVKHWKPCSIDKYKFNFDWQGSTGY